MCMCVCVENVVLFIPTEMSKYVLAFESECLEGQIDLKHQKFMYI